MTPPRVHHTSASALPSALDDRVGLVVHSHLRWDFVWQRPQQILSRLARSNPVLFVEEPILVDDVRPPALDVTVPHDGVYRAVPLLPRNVGSRYDDAIVAIRSLVSDAIATAPLAGHFDRVVQWFYTPMPAPEMLGALGEEGVVYDCMDELANFRFAPPDIGLRERLLLSRADVVFTGGWRLHESKSRFHDNVHFFGCGVDIRHFAAARQLETVIPHDAGSITGPVLGYFGVVDERLDYDLIGALAASHPEWTVLMIGPVVKVDPAELPRAANIRWLGPRSYDQLPAYVKRFDVCLMPFALNEATEFINPTKTLEYMAAGRPIVSTPVADVVRNFGAIVHVASTTREFVSAVERVIEEEPDAARIEAGIARATEASWESTVDAMRRVVASAVGGKETRVAADAAPGRRGHPERDSRTWRSTGTAVPLTLATERGAEAP
ncbi:MAG TPA: glycosyltransferase [Gemmatimonadales bacterium]